MTATKEPRMHIGHGLNFYLEEEDRHGYRIKLNLVDYIYRLYDKFRKRNDTI